MEVKKAPKANIETQKTTFLLMGLVVALAVLFVGFEWSSTISKLDETVIVQDVLAEEEIEITQRDPPPPPPPPPPEPRVVEKRGFAPPAPPFCPLVPDVMIVPLTVMLGALRTT